LLLGLSLTGRARRSLVGPIIAVVTGSLASLVFLFAGTWAPPMVLRLGVLANPFYSSLARAWEFGVGALIALNLDAIARLSARVLGAAGIAGSLAVLAASVLFTKDMLFPGVAVLVPVVGSALMIASGSGSGWLTGVLSVRPLVWIGDLSYSWYLWHWPLIVFSGLIAPQSRLAPLMSAAVSLAPAYLSYRLVEHPIRFAEPFGLKRLTMLVTAATGTAVLAAVVLGVGAREGWGQEWALGAHLVMQRDCDAMTFDPSRCSWTTPEARGSVLLIGDSESWALADGLIPAAASLSYDTVVGSANSCPFAMPAEGHGLRGLQTPECIAHNAAVLRYVRDHTPRIVVIANQSVFYARVDEWRGALSNGVSQLRTPGAVVVLVHVVPRGDEETMRTSLLIRPSGDRFTLRREREQARHDAIEADRFAAGQNPGTLLFDPADVLCDADRCATARGGLQLYSDTAHLSRSGALLLEQPLRALLQRAAAPAPLSTGD
jgi:hypothetical protein